MIYVIGHKTPDTDSIVSAIVMADYLKQTGKKAVAASAGKINKETEFILKKAKINFPVLINNLANKKVFLVDHNELEQAVSGIEKAEIIGIIDHHKLGGIRTNQPIFVKIEPLGSTSTLIFNLFQETKIKIKKNHAFLLLTGIILDTLKLTSPTTTKQDEIALKKLSLISKSNINQTAQEIFKIRSDISGTKMKDLILSDYKDFKEKNIIFGIGVHETTSPENVLNKEKQILLELKKLKKIKKIDLIFFALVDILKNKAWFFLIDEKEKQLAEKAFKSKAQGNLILLPGVVSRKKQMVPLILKKL